MKEINLDMCQTTIVHEGKVNDVKRNYKGRTLRISWYSANAWETLLASSSSMPWRPTKRCVSVTWRLF